MPYYTEQQALRILRTDAIDYASERNLNAFAVVDFVGEFLADTLLPGIGYDARELYLIELLVDYKLAEVA